MYHLMSLLFMQHQKISMLNVEYEWGAVILNKDSILWKRKTFHYSFQNYMEIVPKTHPFAGFSLEYKVHTAP